MTEKRQAEMKYSLTDIAMIRSQILDASNLVASLWPIETFIAVNHLSGLEGLPFQKALHVASKQLNADCFLPRSTYEKHCAAGRIGKNDLAEAQTLASARGSAPSHDSGQEECCQSLAEWVKALTEHDLVEKINRELIKWCGAFFDRGHSIWKMPHRELGFFNAWKRLVALDQSLRFRLPESHTKAVNLPSTASETVLELLSEIGVSAEKRSGYLRRLIVQLPGWASYIKWCQLNSDEEYHQHALIDYLAIRLFYEVEFCRALLKKSPYRLKPNLQQVEKYWTDLQNDGSSKLAIAKQRSLKRTSQQGDSQDQAGDLPLSIWQEAYEINYRNRLLKKLSSQTGRAERSPHPSAQLVFCIDVRSEGIRRHLEVLGDIQTIGFAGFFGLPVAFAPFGSDANRALCPVLLRPKFQIAERIASGGDQAVARWASVNSSKSAFLHVMHFLRSSFVAKFFFAEAAGLWCGPLSLVRTFFPKQLKVVQALHASSRPKQLTLSVEPSPVDDLGITLQDRVFFAEASLNAMRLTNSLSPLVALIGHASQSENNPYASSLDCGACGGNAGGTSARIAAAVLNDGAVRQKLKERRILIPDSTWFVAAEHNTTTDHITVYDEVGIPQSHSSHLQQLKDYFALAGERLRLERAIGFGKEWTDSPLIRAFDWSQTRPEWGLARNSAFIAARRELTRGLDLERRVFLHDYDQEADTSGQILELIMTAPLVVAQWINMQYYLSTVDNNKFGAGTKATHNVIGNIGVMQGVASDLKLGLPWQSVAATDQELYHEPMRLLAIIEASRASIDAIVGRNNDLRNLIANRWIRLIAWEGQSFFEAATAGSWYQLPEFNESEQGPFTELVAAKRGGGGYGQKSSCHNEQN
jgi:uncharacterized protein YbcC (UPF0753/DUF2309 family)